MTEIKHYTCIGCPLGCPLQLTHEGNEIKEVSGNECNRGEKYVKQEFTEPRRNLSTTVFISGGLQQCLPVKVNRPIPKDRIMEAVKKIHKISVKAPVKTGQVLIENFLDEKGLNVVACKSTLNHK